ncbi:chemotaxis protein CheW [Halobacteriovorax sp. GB3]|uniref:chemotaxis protein CheW n=1 Tax=Halobacteriovorax sp. GB3 TaxID=2719615 RepID=UPI0023625A8B|nr:chemotaxis protein CheW [Halobacteriovorax sp. GB3]MDD0854206.1 chemotaxis protein CheW [Halobacteriovorax sp. GB3]
MNEEEMKVVGQELEQLCGFKIGNGHYAISVLEVQEVIKPQHLTPVPLAPDYVKGLINLRGQIVTSISLRTLFGLPEKENEQEHMNIIVRSADSLYSLIVDEILDVMDIDKSTFETTPETLNPKIKKYISGVYKQDRNLLILLDFEKILNEN